MEAIEQREFAPTRSCPQCVNRGTTSIADFATGVTQRSCAMGHTWRLSLAAPPAETDRSLDDFGRFDRMFAATGMSYEETVIGEINKLASSHTGIDWRPVSRVRLR